MRRIGPTLFCMALALTMTAACAPKKAPIATPPPAPQAAPAPQPAQPPVAPAVGVPPAARPPAPPPLLGHLTRVELHEYASWKPLWESPYAPDPAAVATIKSNAKGVTVLVIMATWCPDSKREMPRYFATMDAAGIGDAVLTMVGVDRTKKDAEGLTEQHGITRVPTFVFFRDGKEVGRFVEKTPVGSTFEAEVAKILGGR